VALALCYCGHDPDGEHQEWLDTAAIEQMANWTRYVLAQTRGEGDRWRDHLLTCLRFSLLREETPARRRTSW
jgi:hypothetical protein